MYYEAYISYCVGEKVNKTLPLSQGAFSLVGRLHRYTNNWIKKQNALQGSRSYLVNKYIKIHNC